MRCAHFGVNDASVSNVTTPPDGPWCLIRTGLRRTKKGTPLAKGKAKPGFSLHFCTQTVASLSPVPLPTQGRPRASIPSHGQSFTFIASDGPMDQERERESERRAWKVIDVTNGNLFGRWFAASRRHIASILPLGEKDRSCTTNTTTHTHTQSMMKCVIREEKLAKPQIVSFLHRPGGQGKVAKKRTTQPIDRFGFARTSIGRPWRRKERSQGEVCGEVTQGGNNFHLLQPATGLRDCIFIASTGSCPDPAVWGICGHFSRAHRTLVRTIGSRGERVIRNAPRSNVPVTSWRTAYFRSQHTCDAIKCPMPARYAPGHTNRSFGKLSGRQVGELPGHCDRARAVRARTAPCMGICFLGSFCGCYCCCYFSYVVLL